ncbi:hypothetical protein VFPPC_18310 [Pochonia chlamydosporia 170]|uniref:Uncharacterized protein n=1 Tax=Pochonia chlamydosporia 170 TaxID=1380566 RepID=A0A219APE7_METCM|nr:hypothetical protein VFPPC_18310 [Pochonia chlamydosporia 170]OWT42571.1 hypothetical protein VFPPC_18310 [Pochonia chlamydosporia 170]
MKGKALGIVQVPLSNILCGDGRGAERTRIDPNGRRIVVFIGNSDIPAVLSKLRLTELQLEAANAESNYPLLSSQAVWFTGLRSSLTEAHRMNPLLHLTAHLYSADLSENPSSDGHTYTKLRKCPADGDQAAQQYAALSRAKRRGLKALYWQPEVGAALNALAVFPGIMHDLCLTDWPTEIAPHLQRQVVAHLNHVHAVWWYITGGDPVLQQSADITTVRALEGRAPARSRSDCARVREAFESEIAFRGITDPKRRRAMMQRTCNLLVMIPSLRSFHANMRHLCVIDRILRTYLIPHDLDEPAEEKDRSLRWKLRRFWTRPAPYLEVREGELQLTVGRSSFDQAYKQLVLAALRHFPSLEQPADPDYVCRFQQQAYILGFRNKCTDEAMCVTVPSPSQGTAPVQNQLDEPMLLEPVHLRWGRPSTKLLKSVQASAFLEGKTNIIPSEEGLTVRFLLNDLFDRFLSRVFDIDRDVVLISRGMSTAWRYRSSTGPRRHITSQRRRQRSTFVGPRNYGSEHTRERQLDVNEDDVR